MLTAKDLRQKYLEFFKSKEHAIIPSSSLVPENDPSTLFTGSGMQPMVPYLLGEKHPMGKRIVDSQKCFRSQDIEEVGDNRHTTMFEMLGNWSLGDYFKKEQIVWMFEFLTKVVGLDPENIYVTVFSGNEKLGIPRDSEAVGFWQEEFAKIGIEAKDATEAEKNGMQDGIIFYYDEKKNWWSRVGVPNNMPNGEPGGPDSEMFWDFGAELKLHENSQWKNEQCHVNCDCGRFLEIGNNVFMQYVKTEKGFELLPNGNIDFGGGLERIAAAANGNPDIFLTDLFSLIIEKIEEISGKKYAQSEETKRSFRVIADHLKASAFLISDGVVPSNTEQGYFLRRLIRRAVRYGKIIGIENNFAKLIAEVVMETYKDAYPELEQNKTRIFEELEKEEEKFRKTLEKGLREFDKEVKFMGVLDEPKDYSKDGGSIKGHAEKVISGETAFKLFATYGFPIEMTVEIAGEKGFKVDLINFKKELKKHQELSRTASVGMFKGGLSDTKEETTTLHTTAHLMLSGLRKVLGSHVHQKGSNINGERLRFDFSHPDKMTDEQKKAVEDFVNEAIGAKVPVVMQEMTVAEANEFGAEGEFGHKYGERVKVYTIQSAQGGPAYSREICGGPHVSNTGDIKGVFRIKKEESSSAGVRRIKAVIE